MFFEILLAGSVLYLAKLLLTDTVNPVLHPSLLIDIEENPVDPVKLQRDNDLQTSYSPESKATPVYHDFQVNDVMGVVHAAAKDQLDEYDVNNYPMWVTENYGVYVDQIGQGANKDAEWRNINV